jgi:hypothetical protein
MKPQFLMKGERVLQPPPEIKPPSKTKQKPPIKPQRKVKPTRFHIILSSQGRTHIFSVYILFKSLVFTLT